MIQTTEMKILKALEDFIEVKAVKAFQDAFRVGDLVKNRVHRNYYEGEKRALSAVREEIQRLKEENTN